MDRFQVKFIRLNEIRLHPEVQRPLRKQHVQRIANNFDPDAFDVIWVMPAKRGSGYWVFKGRHRTEAARIALGNEQMVPCRVFEDLDKQTAAQLFIKEATVLRTRPVDHYRMELLAGNLTAMGIRAALAVHGLAVSSTRGPGTVMAVSALRHVWNVDGGKAVLPRVLGILFGAWGRDPYAYDATLLRGLGYVVHQLAKVLDDADVALKLARCGAPKALPVQARQYAAEAEISVERAMAHKIIRILNKGRRTGARLELP